MLADAPSLCPKKLMSSLFARPTQRHAIMPGQPCQGRDSTSSSRRCAVFEMWVFILAWTDMVAVGAGQPSCCCAAKKAKARDGQGKLVGELEGKRRRSAVRVDVRGGARAGRGPARGAGLLAC